MKPEVEANQGLQPLHNPGSDLHNGLAIHLNLQARTSSMLFLLMTPANNKGIVDEDSNYSVEQTVNRLKNILESSHKVFPLAAARNVTVRPHCFYDVPGLLAAIQACGVCLARSVRHFLEVLDELRALFGRPSRVLRVITGDRQRTAELIDVRSDARQDLEDIFHPPLHNRLVLDGPPCQLEVLASR